MPIETFKADCVVVGAGVVGLAVARKLSMSGRQVVVLEKAATIGSDTSSRNSGVIHAGLYYPQDSLKAQLCVKGKTQLYAYLSRRGIAHRRCGKLIVATRDTDLKTLEQLRQNAAASGVSDLTFLDRSQTLQKEPVLQATGSLLSPSTGILDTHAYMLSLQGALEDQGGLTAFRTCVTGGTLTRHGFVLELSEASRGGNTTVSGKNSWRLTCRTLINAAGCHAPALARRLHGLPARYIPQPFLAKGSYFTLKGPTPFSRLVYPVPDKDGLGIHLTLDLDGRARFGPDVEWVEKPDYTVDENRAEKFYRAIRTYWPALSVERLQPGYAGLRPRISAPGEPLADFMISGPPEHRQPGLVNLFGIESPGLTASLAIADHVLTKLA